MNSFEKPIQVCQAFGLRIASELPLPELLPATTVAGEGVPAAAGFGGGAAKAGADVTITLETGMQHKWQGQQDTFLSYWGSLCAAGDNFIAVGEDLWFKIPETAIFKVSAGSRIQIFPLPGADLDKVRLYLLGTCMGVLLLQRGCLPLHGSAIVSNGQAYAIVGHSGAGKSTLAAALVARGCRLLSDDVIAIEMRSAADEGQAGDKAVCPLVYPAYPQQKLWSQSLAQLGLRRTGLRPVHLEADKYAVPATLQFHNDAVPLAGIIELVARAEPTAEGTERAVEATAANGAGVSGFGSSGLALSRLTGAERLRIPIMHTYRNKLIQRLGLQGWHLGAAARIAETAELYQLHRPAGVFTAEALAELVLALAERQSERKETIPL